jgi:arylsulfatase A-like enzyme
VDWDLRSNQRRSDATTDAALKWLEEVDSPFYLWVHYWDPHDKAMLPPRAMLNEWVGPDLEGLDREKAIYDAEIRFVDEQMGRLIETLKQRHLYDNTVVVVIADHGQGLGDHGWWHHRILYQEQIRVPLVMRLPGGPENMVVPDLVRSIDVFPTVLDWLGIETNTPVDGRSLRPLIRSQPEERRIAYADQLNLYDLNAAMVRARPQDDLLYCAMDGSWKLIHRPTNPSASELFHIARDPHEQVNLYASEPDQAKRLLEVLERSGGFVGQPFDSADDPDRLERLRSLGYVGGR